MGENSSPPILKTHAMKSVIFQDKTGNHYLYSFTKRRLLYISKVLYEIIKAAENSDCDNLSKHIIASSSDKDIKRRVNQFLFLKDKGYLDEYTCEWITSLNPTELHKSFDNISNIAFELTNKCNLQCTYCFYGELYEHKQKSKVDVLDVNYAYIIIDELCKQVESKKALSVKRNITLGFYGGEALLEFDLIKQIVEYSQIKQSDNLKFTYTLTTNGLLLRKHIEYLVEKNFSILISLDGDYKNSEYRQTTKGDNVYPKIYETIKYISKKYPNYFRDNISFNSVLHDKNSVEELVGFFWKEFGKIPMISELSFTCVKKEKREILAGMYNRNSLNNINFRTNDLLKHYLLADSRIKNIPKLFYKLLNINFKSWSDWICDYKYLRFPTSTCIPFVNKIFVSTDGKLHLCEHIGYDYSYAYINIEDRRIVFDEKDIAKRYSAYYSNMIPKCKKCYMAFSCNTCLFEANMQCTPIDYKGFCEIMADAIEKLKIRENYKNNE